MIQSSFRCIAPSGTHVKETHVERCVRTRKSRPGKRKVWIKLHCPLEKTDGFFGEIAREIATCLKSQTTEIGLVSFRIVCWFSSQRLFLAARELGLQCIRNSFGNL